MAAAVERIVVQATAKEKKAIAAKAKRLGLPISEEHISSGELEETKDETAALTRDIHGAIAALQFEDIVRQQIGLVITELQQLRKAQDEMAQDLAPLDRQGARST